jgi:hypothetical protein
MNKKELSNKDWFEFDTDFYNLIQKHFKYELNEDESLFNWYCKLRNKIEKQIIKQAKSL